MSAMEVTPEMLAAKFEAVFPHLDERQRRLLLGAEARSLGHGGIRAVARAAGVSETTVRKGVDEVKAGEEPLGRVRRPGGGRKRVAEVDRGLRPALLTLVERACQIFCVSGRGRPVMGAVQRGRRSGNWRANALRAFFQPWVPVPA